MLPATLHTTLTFPLSSGRWSITVIDRRGCGGRRSRFIGGSRATLDPRSGLGTSPRAGLGTSRRAGSRTSPRGPGTRSRGGPGTSPRYASRSARVAGRVAHGTNVCNHIRARHQGARAEIYGEENPHFTVHRALHQVGDVRPGEELVHSGDL